MATKASTLILKDFTGGLWQNEGDPPNLSFTTAASNFEIVGAGGMQKRRPILQDFLYNPGSLTLPTIEGGRMAVCAHPNDSTAFFVMLSPSGANSWPNHYTSGTWHVLRFTKGNAVPVWDRSIVLGSAPSGLSVVYGSSQAGERVYATFGGSGLGTTVMDAAAGTVIVVTAATANDNLAAPTNGTFPAAVCLVAHLAYMFAGNCVDIGVGSGIKPNRLHWSHPNRYQDWRTNDFVLVGDASEKIIGLHSFREQLVIVKETSIWILTGYDPSTFALRRLVDFKDFSNSAWGLYLLSCSHPNIGVVFSKPYDSVYMFDGTSIKDIGGPLKDAFKDGRILPAGMQILNNKLYVSIQALNFGLDTTTGMYVYDFQLGCWSRHTGAWHGLLGSNDQLAAGYAVFNNGVNAGFRTAHYQKATTESLWADTYSGSSTFYQASYRSPWIDLGQPATKKRFKRAWIRMDKRGFDSVSANPLNYSLNVFRNYDGITIAKSASLAALKALNTTEYDTNWGYGHNARGSDSDVFQRMSSLGNARSVQLEIFDSSSADRWGIDSITIPYIPKRLH